ncbi:GPI transamidase component, partial [Coemansia interrupta]
MPLPARLQALFRRRSNPKTLISTHSERLVVLLSILVVCLLGLPLWWTTTRVYRADLPTDEIARFTPRDPLRIPFAFHIDDSADSLLPSSELAAIKQGAARLIDKQRVPYARGEWPVRYEAVIMPGPAPDIPGHYTLKTKRAPSSKARVSVEIGVDRIATVSIPSTVSAASVLEDLISAIVAKEERELRRITSGLPSQKSEATANRALKYSPEYAVTFTLLNEDPVGGVTVDWDIEAAISSYIQPFIDLLHPVTKLSVTSQVLHDAGPPPFKPVKTSNQTLLSPSMLAHFVNSPSWNLASTDPVSPMLNFILYVPSLESQPVYITRDNNRLHTNAFLVSQWGGVAIANLPAETKVGSHIVLSSSDMQGYMGAFISQLRELIGIRRYTPLDERPVGTIQKIRVHQATLTGISTWEQDALLRQWLVSTRLTAISTLQSLSRLVESMQNMVVMDEIKTKVDGAIQELTSIQSTLSSSTDHLTACKHATRASVLAESAFFDPSMVSLLYFPDQHKYAIYLPFFLPAAMPLITALKRVIKERKS